MRLTRSSGQTFDFNNIFTSRRSDAGLVRPVGRDDSWGMSRWPTALGSKRKFLPMVCSLEAACWGVWESCVQRARRK